MKYFLFGHSTWTVESQFSDQGSNPRPLHWELGVLTTGLPGQSCPLPPFLLAPGNCLLLPALTVAGSLSFTSQPHQVWGSLWHCGVLWKSSAVFAPRAGKSRLLKAAVLCWDKCSHALPGVWPHSWWPRQNLGHRSLLFRLPEVILGFSHLPATLKSWAGVGNLGSFLETHHHLATFSI